MAKIEKLHEVAVDKLKPYERNAKLHGKDQIEKLKASITAFGFLTPCLIDAENNLIAGHGRVMAAKELGLKTVPCVTIEDLTDEERRAYILADNRLSELGEWDMETVQFELNALEDLGFDVSIIGFEFDREAFGSAKEKEQEEAVTTLRDRFLVPPFSVFDTRTAWWTNRKRAWKSIGIRSEVGRSTDGDASKPGLIYSLGYQGHHVYKLKNEYEDAIGRPVTWEEFIEANPSVKMNIGYSVFDPVITETAVRWYSKQGDSILDPFAGGSVRGVVSALLGRHYTGVDLSERQIKANIENWKEIRKEPVSGDEIFEPRWIVGDSLEIDKHAGGRKYDMLLTCPPYADLEVYSKDERDLSNMSYEDFAKTYREIIKKSVALLKDDAFAFVVVGDVRDKTGNYRNFVGLTIDAFISAGMAYYNEGILVNQTGSIATVVSRQFVASRKAGKNHQNVLVFYGVNKIEKVNLDDPEETEAAYFDELQRDDNKIVINHEKALVFIKGNAKQRTEELGDVEADTSEDFYVSLGEDAADV